MSVYSSAFSRVLAAAFVAAVFCSGAARAAERFTLLTDWFAQAEHGGFYEAQAEGLYERAGLDVDIRMGGPQINGMQLLLAGEVDAIIGGDFQVLDAVEKGLPVVTVGATFQHDLQGMMTHADVKRLSDLRDRPLLVATVGRVTWWPWYKQKFGASDEQLKPYTFNLQPFFADPKAAQQAYPSSEPFQAEQKGIPVNFFLFADDGYPPYGTTLITTRKILETKPAVLQAFVTASMQGWSAYLKNSGPANALIKAANPSMSDAQIAFGIAKLRSLGVLDGRGTVPVGTMTDARWKATFDYMVGAGLLHATTYWHRAFTTQFVKNSTVTLD